MINVETFVVGFLGTNCYIVTDKATKRRAVIDTGYKSAELVARIKELGADSFDYILLTHGHFDHIWFADEVKILTGAKLVISVQDSPFLSDSNLNLTANFGIKNFPSLTADVTLDDGDTLMLGETKLSYMLTPGHTAGSGCYISFDDKTIFSGDTLFKLSQGRTDFVTGSNDQMQNSLHRLSQLSGDFTVYPGHGEATTLDYERQNNPYVR